MLTVTEHPSASLLDAIGSIKKFLESLDGREDLTPSELRALEHQLDAYQAADEAFAQEIERIIRASAPRPRR